MTRRVGTTFTEVTRVRCAPEVLFDLSLSIDAHLDSMRRSHERAVAGVTSGTIGLGESVTWRARHFGVMWTMTSQITALERPRRFVDEQVRGPFRVFRHEHRFERDGDVTVMTDTVTLRSPLLGVVVEPLLLLGHPLTEGCPTGGGWQTAPRPPLFEDHCEPGGHTR